MKKNSGIFISTMAFMLLIACSCSYAAENIKVGHGSLKLVGYLKSWFQYSQVADEKDNMTFSTRMARLVAKGQVNEQADYKVLVDLARFQKDILMEASLSFAPISGLRIVAGQSKTPFSSAEARFASVMPFINRCFITTRKIAPPFRDIGVQASYKNEALPQIEFIGGLFNGTGINKLDDNNSKNFAFRVLGKPLKSVHFAGNVYLGKTNGADPENLFIYDLDVGYNVHGVDLGTEFAVRDESEKIAAAFFVYGEYEIGVNTGILKSIVPATRFEVWEPDSDREDDHQKRITLGLSFEFDGRSYSRLRVNYEVDTRENGEVPNILTAEVQLRF